MDFRIGWYGAVGARRHAGQATHSELRGDRMTNAEIKELRARVESGRLLGKEEQLYILQQLFRANRRVQAAKKAGFNVEPNAAGD